MTDSPPSSRSSTPRVGADHPSKSDPAPAARPRATRVARRIFKFVLAQWLIIGFAIACVLAYFFPSVAATGGTIKSEYSILYGAVAFIFLVSGLQLAPKKLVQNATNWRLHVLVQGISFLVIPAIVLAVVHVSIAAGCLTSDVPSTPIIVGLVVVSCIPTTIASNVVMTRSAGGDDAAAIISVVLGNVGGSWVAPILIFGFMPASPADVFDSWQPANPSTLGTMYANVAKQLGLSVILPLAVGQGVRWWKDELTLKVVTKLRLAKVSALCLTLLVWTTFSNAFETGAIFQLSTPNVLFIIFMNVALYLIFTVICFYAARPPLTLARHWNPIIFESRLTKNLPEFIKRAITFQPMSKEQTIAVCFCGAAKTTSLGIPLVTAMWAQADDLTRAFIEIPVLLYTIEQVFMAQILVYFFKRFFMREGVEGEKSDEEAQSGEPALVTDHDHDETTIEESVLHADKDLGSGAARKQAIETENEKELA